jgi:subtilisin-like proprotein convertase family protein
MSLSFRSLHASQSEVIRRGNIETDHHQDLIVHGIAPDSIHQNRRQVSKGRVVDAILQLQQHGGVGLGATVVVGSWYIYVM